VGDRPQVGRGRCLTDSENLVFRVGKVARLGPQAIGEEVTYWGWRGNVLSI